MDLRSGDAEGSFIWKNVTFFVFVSMNSIGGEEGRVRIKKNEKKYILWLQRSSILYAHLIGNGYP